MTTTDTTPLPYIRDPRPMADGGIMTVHNLPKAGERGRWTALYKMIVAEAITHGLISEQEAIERYCATAAELRRWRLMLEREGRDGLKANNFAGVDVPEQLADLETFQDGPLALDLRKRSVRLNGQLVDLPPLHIKVLSILVRGAPAVVSRDLVFALVYGGRVRQPESKILDVIVCHLRRKLGAGCIETSWGRGWQWRGIA